MIQSGLKLLANALDGINNPLDIEFRHGGKKWQRQNALILGFCNGTKTGTASQTLAIIAVKMDRFIVHIRPDPTCA